MSKKTQAGLQERKKILSEIKAKRVELKARHGIELETIISETSNREMELEGTI